VEEKKNRIGVSLEEERSKGNHNVRPAVGQTKSIDGARFTPGGGHRQAGAIKKIGREECSRMRGVRSHRREKGGGINGGRIISKKTFGNRQRFDLTEQLCQKMKESSVVRGESSGA